MIKPKITVIIPTFQRPHLLARAIKSVLAQTYGDFLIVVSDNLSGDKTIDVVNSYAAEDSRVSYRCNSKNIGAIENMKQSVASVTTDFYCLLNDDDFLLPNFFDEAMRGFDSHPDAAFSCVKTLVLNLVDEKIYLRNSDWQGGFYTPTHSLIRKMRASHFTTTGIIFRREVREQLGCFEASGNDVLYLTIAASMYPFFVADSYGAVFTMHSQSYSNKGGTSLLKVDKLYEMFVETMSAVLSLDVSSDKKTHLIKLVSDSYFRDIERNKVLSHHQPLIVNAENFHLRLSCSKTDILMTLLHRLPNYASNITSWLTRLLIRVSGIRTKNSLQEIGLPIPSPGIEIISCDRYEKHLFIAFSGAVNSIAALQRERERKRWCVVRGRN